MNKKSLCKFLSAIPFLANLFGCGGGSETTPSTRFDKLLYGYFGDFGNQLEETKDHVNVVFIASWYGDKETAEGREIILNEQISRLKAAKEAGIGTAILMLDYTLFTEIAGEWILRPENELEVNLDIVFRRIKQEGLADFVKVLYLIDEPNLHSVGQEELREVTEIVRSASKEILGKDDMKLAVIYSSLQPHFVGMEYFDWVGFDDYDLGDTIFTMEDFQRLKTNLSETQRLILVPGGASPYQTLINAFYEEAKNESKVVLICPFIWFDNWANTGNNGIKSSSTRQSYVSVGSEVKQQNPQGLFLR